VDEAGDAHPGHRHVGLARRAAGGAGLEGAVTMGAARNRFELRIGTLLSPAALAAFRVPVRPTSVPRNTVYRLRIPADRDLTDVLHRLIEQHVELLEIRRGPEPPRRSRRRPAGDELDVPGPDDTGVVVPFRAGPRSSSAVAGPDTRPPLGPVPYPPDGGSAG
jgi:hypothetical protein